MPQGNNTSLGERDSIRTDDELTEKVTPKREEVQTMPPSKESHSCEESGETPSTDFQSKRDKWRSYHEQSPEAPTAIAKVKGRPRGTRASFWQNKIETVGDAREVTSSAQRLQEMREEIQQSRKPWNANLDFNTEIGNTEEETPTIEAVKCRPRGTRASFWENKICNIESETETVDHCREIAHRQKMEEEILRFRRPWRKTIRAVEVTEEVAQTSGDQTPEEPSSSSDFSSEDEEKVPSDSSSTDEEYYNRIDEMKRQAKLKKELTDNEMDQIIFTELENWDILKFAKKSDDSKKSYQEQALSDSSSDEEYYAKIEEQKRQAKLKRELDDDEMDAIIISELENWDVLKLLKKSDDSKQSAQFNAEKRENIHSRAAAVTEKKSTPEKYAEHKTPDVYKVIEKKFAPPQAAEIAQQKTHHAEVHQAKEKSTSELSSDIGKQKTPAEVLQDMEKYAAEQATTISEQKIATEVPEVTEKKPAPEIAEVAQPTEEMSAPEQSLEIADLKVSTEVPQVTEKKPVPDTAEQKAPEVTQVMEKSAPEQAIKIAAQAEVPLATEEMSAPRQSADKQQTPVEVSQAMDKKSALEQAAGIAEQTTSAEVPKAIREKSVPEQMTDINEKKTTAQVPQDIEKYTPKQSADIDERETSGKVPKTMEEKSANEQSPDLAEQKVAAKDTHAIATRTNRSSSKGEENIAELVNLFYEAHGHPSGSTTQKDDIAELAIVVAQHEAQNASMEFEETGTGDMKGGEQGYIIQKDIHNGVTAHPESIGQKHRYSQPEDLTQLDEIEVYYDAVSDSEDTDTPNQRVDLGEKFHNILEKTQQQENTQNMQVNEVSGWKRFLKKVGLATIGTSFAVGGLYLLITQADDDTVKWLWNTASKILPFIEPIPEPEPEKSFLWKLLEALLPSPPPPPPPDKNFLLKLFQNLPSLALLR